MLQLAFAMFILTAFCPTSLSSSDSLNFMVFVLILALDMLFMAQSIPSAPIPPPPPRAFVNSSRNG